MSKPAFLKVSYTDFYRRVSLINNIINEDRLEVLTEFDNSSSAETNAGEIEQFIDGKFGEMIKNIKKNFRKEFLLLEVKIIKWQRKLNF